MREYILEKVKDTTKFFSAGGIEIEIRDELPEGFNLQQLFNSIEKTLPGHFFANLIIIRFITASLSVHTAMYIAKNFMVR